MAIIDIENAPRGLVARVANLLANPSREWARIEKERAGIAEVCGRYACLLAAIPPICLATGNQVFGVGLSGFEMRPSFAAAALEAGVSYGLSMVGLFLLAMAVNALAPVFGGVSDARQAFKAVAYSATATWVAGAFLIAPQLSALSLTGLYSIVLLHRGLPRLMKVPQGHAIAYVVLSVLIGLALALAIGSATAALEGALLRLNGA